MKRRPWLRVLGRESLVRVLEEGRVAPDGSEVKILPVFSCVQRSVFCRTTLRASKAELKNQTFSEKVGTSSSATSRMDIAWPLEQNELSHSAQGRAGAECLAPLVRRGSCVMKSRRLHLEFRPSRPCHAGQFLQGGATGALGLTLGDVVALRAAARERVTPGAVGDSALALGRSEPSRHV